jgi:aminoglycoside 3-N-acetyltransferase
MPPARPPVTRSALAADLRRLGVERAGTLMVHTRMSAIGWIVGGSETVVRALLEALGPEGTLVAYTSWEWHTYDFAEWPKGARRAYESDPPGFDPQTSEAARDHGRIPERIRTWPGARRSAHPEASVAAVGAAADWLTQEHPERGYGVDTPFARLVEIDARVLMLGAPLDTLTLLHHAEAIAHVPHKREISYRVPVTTGDGVEWRELTDIETSGGAFAYEEQVGDEDPFEVIARAALAAGIGRAGLVGEAPSHLFPAPELVSFATSWMEQRFGGR